MLKRKGAPLFPGAGIGIVAPGSPVHSPERMKQGIARLTSKGYRVVLGVNTEPKSGDLAGADPSRLAELEQMWRDGSITAIWGLRGGYGSIRLLPELDYKLFRENPKLLIGFSDLTALELGLWSRAGLVTFHGPVLTTLEEDFSCNQALTMLTDLGALGASAAPLPWPDPGFGTLVPIKSGKAKGILLGGNLITLCSLIGTRFFPDLRGVLLFLEEIGEAAYRIDRLLTQLLFTGALDQVAAVLVGQSIPAHSESEAALISVFTERLSCLNCPSAYGFPIGHLPKQWTLPQGIAAEVDTETGELVILENPTK
ncbi:MAG TPA: LD-carboxypeptidase [Bacillota bacterium]|nr:LD-carboxypeptidase [Bacillota bacterium]